MKWFIDKYGVYANLDKLFIKKLFDIKLFLEQIKPELNPLDIIIPEVKYDHLMIQKKTYFISLVHDSFEIQIPAPIDGVFIVEGIEKIIISQELFCTPIFIYKNDCIEYKECNKEGKFQSPEMFTDYKYIEYVRKVLNKGKDEKSIKNFSNEHTKFDFYYTFLSKDCRRKLTKMKRHVLLDIRFYYSLFFQLLRVKGIKSHEKQSISLVYVLRYLKPEFSLSEIKQIIIENVIGKNIPENIEIMISDSSPETTLESILSHRKESKEEIISIINGMIDSYLTPDSLHCDRSSYDDINTKFYTYLCMARVFLDFNSSKSYFSNRIDCFPCSIHRKIKYFGMDRKNKKLDTSSFVSNLNLTLYNMVKSGTIRSYFCEYSSIAVQTLSKRSYYDKLSHIRRVQIPINTESENLELRLSYQYGYFCPFETPESKDVGLVKYFGLSVLIAPDFTMDLSYLSSVLYDSPHYNDFKENKQSDKREYPVLLNSRFISFTTCNLAEFTYRDLKLRYPFISCIFDEVAYYLFTDEGRIVRPLRVRKGNIVFGIRFIDVAEYISNSDFEYEELDPNFIFGLISALSPFPGNNHVSRLTFQAGMTKQCMSNDSTIFNFNDNSRKLINAQKPFCMTNGNEAIDINSEIIMELFKNMESDDNENLKNEIDTDSSHNNDDNGLCNKFCKNVEERNDENKQYQEPEYEHHNKNIESSSEKVNLDNEEFRKSINELSNIEIERDQSILITKNNNYHIFNGQNAVVAIMAFGNNQEDSVIFNETSIENGMFANIKYRYQYISYSIQDEILININSNYENGLPKPNTLIARNSFYSNEPLFRIYNFTKNEVRDIENIFKRLVYVDHCTTFVEDDICYCCVEILIGSIMPEQLNPRTEFGIIPDIIVNPHAFPSRVTVGHLIEMFVGKCMVMDPQRFGTFFDASIESNDIKNFEANYIDSVIPIMEKMVDSITGKFIGEAFVGVCYYTALQHQVEEKMFYRILGNVNAISKQPTEGKSQNSGLRIGEMERDALIAHRANAILQDMFKNNTDLTEIKYCNVCHSLGTKDTCCDTSTKTLSISNSFNIMNSYLESISLHTKIYE
ncbi:beta and beta-prime subunits of DNA dependent RNA-polymerase [Neocallimastix lanati (nom. inval.)]|nr:beta and beta-prime subunits of DNA dependent RNA-polymerase [Neocallimastix sp. JGI-2020a]